ncbi:unnamed protein product [Prorocentrum cordatum]|uniref:Alpha-1,2-Mannosidase n=1 Tax=Prorocentrum cordatum TaxID=2364126 RepID=A0ABN9VWL7_9DINO|nr:unnamed protein product [Polarella glacialis]
MLSSDHNGARRFPYGDSSPWSIRGDAVCREWLLQRDHPGEHPDLRFPFLCAGAFMGTAAALRRLYARLFSLYRATREYHDQALLTLLLLRNQSLGFVDEAASLFLSLHGHDEMTFHGGYATRVTSRPQARALPRRTPGGRRAGARAGARAERRAPPAASAALLGCCTSTATPSSTCRAAWSTSAPTDLSTTGGCTYFDGDRNEYAGVRLSS